MFNSKFNNLLTILLVIAIIAIIGIIIFFGYSVYNKYYINKSAEDAVQEFYDAVSTTNEEENNEEETERTEVTEEVAEGSSIYSTSSSGKTQYYGYNVVGTISIPTLNIEYPILEKVTVNSLKVAVAYLSGAGVNQVGNTVIQGHNYRNGLFFSNLSKLSNGDKIYITDTSGTKIEYAVYSNFSAEATDTSFYDRDTDGAREITLSTCTTDAAIRTIILAKEVENT